MRKYQYNLPSKMKRDNGSHWIGPVGVAVAMTLVILMSFYSEEKALAQTRVRRVWGSSENASHLHEIRAGFHDKTVSCEKAEDDVMFLTL